jgi:hypothetical protein
MDDSELGKVVLERQIPVGSYKDLELRFCQRQQTPVLNPVPAHILDGLDFVARQITAQPPIQALVEQQFHFRRARAIFPPLPQ